MALLRLPAIEHLYQTTHVLEHLIEQMTSVPCTQCGFPTGTIEEIETLVKACMTQARTCAAILDRTGLGPRSTVEVRTNDASLDMSLLTDDERVEMIRITAEWKALKARINERLHGAAFNVTATQPQAPRIM